jgi:putative ABC transport system permease protein
MTGLGQDLHYALRQLRRSPGITLAAPLILGLGIGVNTAIVTVFYQVLLRSLPVRRANELVLLKEYSRFETGRVDIWDGEEQMYFAYPAYQALCDGNKLLEGLAASTVAPATIVSAKDADKVMMQWVTGNYFNLLGVQPVLGRLLTPSDDVQHAGTAVAVLSESYWHAHFGGDSSILDQQLQINGSPFTIVGVVRHDGLMDSAPPAVFLPISVGQAVVPGRQDLTIDPLHRILNIIGRLPAAVSRQEAEAQLNTIWWNWRRDVLKARKENISDEKGWLETHLSFADGARGITVLEGTLGEPLRILEAMAFVVLLIACGNMANLLLVKAARKRIELALHAALGGSRRRIFQKLISEGLLLGLTGAGLGLLLGAMTLKLLLGMLPSTNALRGMLSIHMEWSVLMFCGIAGVTTSIGRSTVPAILSTRIHLLGVLQQRRDSVFGSSAGLRNLLVAAEIALSLFLLSGAAVLSWRLHELRNTDPGYDSSRHMLTFRVDASILGESDVQVRNASRRSSAADECCPLCELHSCAKGDSGRSHGGLAMRVRQPFRGRALQGRT